MRRIFLALCLAHPAIAAESPGATAQAWQQAWNAKQPEAAASLFAADAVFINANGQAVSGGAAIGAMFQRMLKEKTPTLEMSPLAQGQAGNEAWISGSSRQSVPATRTRPVRKLLGSYLIVVHRAPAGGWRIEKMMWSAAENR